MNKYDHEVDAITARHRDDLHAAISDIANKYHMDYGLVTFWTHGRGYIVRGMNCYDRVVEIFVKGN
jgi:hypothetical protein